MTKHLFMLTGFLSVCIVLELASATVVSVLIVKLEILDRNQVVKLIKK